MAKHDLNLNNPDEVQIPQPDLRTVASMLLIFPCVRLDCVPFASKPCLDYVWSVNIFMLTLWAILPAQVSLPSLVEVVSLLHNWIRSPSRPLNEDHVDFVCASVQIWSPGFHFFGPCFGFHFGHRFEALQLHTKSTAPERRSNMEPKTRTTSTKEAMETWAGKIAQRVSKKKRKLQQHSWESKIAFIFLDGGFRLGVPLWWALSFYCKSAVDFQPHWWERVHYCNFFSFVPWTGQATKYTLLGSSANDRKSFISSAVPVMQKNWISK